MTRARRFSQAISEGDGISVIVEVRDVEAARAAEEQGAEAILLRAPVGGVREATALPILWRPEGPPADAQSAGADACVLVLERLGREDEWLRAIHAEALELGLDCLVEVRNEEELEDVLEQLDPEIFLLTSGNRESDDEELERVLELLPDVPAGKLAVAETRRAGRDDVVALERAGFDAVIVPGGDISALVGGPPPEV